MRPGKPAASTSLRSLGTVLRAAIDAGAAAVHALASERPATQSEPPVPVVSAIVLDAHGRPLARGGIEYAKAPPPRGDEDWLWLDFEAEAWVAGPVLAGLGLPDAALRSISQPKCPPAAIRFADTLMVVYHEFIERPAVTRPLAVYVTDRLVATWHPLPSPAVAVLRGTLGVPDSPTRPDSLAAALGRQAAGRLVEAADRYEEALDDIEDRVFGEPDDSLLEQLTAFKSELRLLARAGRSHERVAERLRDEPRTTRTPQHERDLDAFREQSDRLRGLASMYAETAGDLTDGYLAMSAHRLNRVMQILTVITVIFVPLTFLAGIYGMNFQHMPELGTPYGYFILLGVMFAAGIVQAVFFRRKRWI